MNRCVLSRLWPLCGGVVLAALATPACVWAASQATVRGPDRELGLEALRIGARGQVQVDEGHLIVLMEYTLGADRPGTLRLDRTPLELPLLAPAVRGVVLDRGTIPEAAQAVEVAAEGVTVEKHQGGLRVRGSIAPGAQATVRVRYPLAFAGPRLELGLRGTAGRTRFEVAVGYPPPVRVQLASDRPARVTRFEQGRERVIGLFLAQPLGPGQAARIIVGDLPVAARWPGRMLLELAALLALATLAVMWRGRAPTARTDAATTDRGDGNPVREPGRAGRG